MRDKVAPKKEVDALLAEGAKRLGVPLSTGRLSALLFYLAELKRWNEKINLTGLREDQEIVVKHFLDSLTPLSILDPEEAATWIDIGTGAGFPGLVLKIARPSLRMTLVESVEKKVTFLHHLIGRLALAGVTVVHDRLERLAERGWKGAFDLLLSRALAPELILEKGTPLVRSGGKVVLFQGRAERGAWEGRLRGREGMTLEAIAPIDLPFSDIRRNLVIIKVIGRSA